MKRIGQPEVLRNRSVPMALCPSQIGLGSNCRLRGERLTTRRSPQCQDNNCSLCSSAAPLSRLITLPSSPQSRSPDFSAHLSHYFFLAKGPNRFYFWGSSPPAVKKLIEYRPDRYRTVTYSTCAAARRHWRIRRT